ncbi:MAG: cysteine--tRNA ligase [Patescibacteria group bacterium]|nr:cysteine--tRNA ligase [Patescibacteria group bacterium]
MFLFNTLTRKIEKFQPLQNSVVTFYTCGPTVYDYTHLGHMRTYVNNDLLRRTLTYLGFQVKHVMNITDVGHLTGDDDTGEDKIEKGARKAGKTVWEIAEFYTNFFLKTITELNILLPQVFCRATQHIQEMIDLIKILEKKGFTYETKEAVYFDTCNFAGYGKLGGQNLKEKLPGAREEVYVDKEKKHPTDFALWFKRVGRFANHTLHWDSPWGDGFPGWHIECSAMSMKYLGQTIDIHAGGVDHIPVHHENEIAQSEAATGQPFVRFWFHNHFLMVNNQKMSKSLGNIYTIEDIKKRTLEPLAIRYQFLQSHYRSVMNFTWESAKAAQEGFRRLKNLVSNLHEKNNETSKSQLSVKAKKYEQEFKRIIANDLQIPQGISLAWAMLRDKNLPPHERLSLILDFDQVFGLGLERLTLENIPQSVINLAEERKNARQVKDYLKADRIREKIETLGYLIEDLSDNRYRIRKKFRTGQSAF